VDGATIDRTGVNAAYGTDTVTLTYWPPEQLVVSGMKLTPCNPTMLNARDAIIQADANLNAGANRCKIWAAFAGLIDEEWQNRRELASLAQRRNGELTRWANERPPAPSAARR